MVLRFATRLGAAAFWFLHTVCVASSSGILHCSAPFLFYLCLLRHAALPSDGFWTSRGWQRCAYSRRSRMANAGRGMATRGIGAGGTPWRRKRRAPAASGTLNHYAAGICLRWRAYCTL